MPFQKGNKLWMKGIETKKEKQQKIEAFIATLANGGMERYAEIMDKLADNKELTKAEVQYLDRIDGWREYVLPKLARTESKVDQKITYTQYDNKPDSELEEELNRLSASVSREKQKKV